MSLSSEELDNVNSLYSKLLHHDHKNNEKEKYYEGKNRVSSLGIAIPPQLSQAQNIVGWASTVVNVIEERLDFRGYIDAANTGIQDIYRANDLGTESSLAHRDALLFGVSYVVVGRGDVQNGEPEILMTVESPKKMTSNYNFRKRRLDSALSITRDGFGNPKTGALYLENETVYLEFKNNKWIDVDRDVHNLGRVPVALHINNPRSGEAKGSSEITPAIMGNIKEASRSLLHMAISSEFFSTPQRYILGASEGAFEDADGNPIDAWTAIVGRISLLARDEDGNLPQVGEFKSNSPEPFIAQTKLYASLCAANAGIPVEYFGVENNANPTSGDALRVRETRLIKTAERKQAAFSKGWLEAARIALLIRDGVIPEDFNTSVKVDWKDPSQITQSAAADATQKLISSGVLLPDSEVTYNRVGLSDAEKVVIQSEKAQADAQLLVANLAQAVNQVTPQIPEG